MKKCTHIDSFLSKYNQSSSENFEQNQAKKKNHLEKIISILLDLNHFGKALVLEKEDASPTNLKYLKCEQVNNSELFCSDDTSRLHLCAYCFYIGCFSLTNRCHIEQHSLKTGHNITLDAVYAAFYCFECRDFQYNSEIDALLCDSFNKASYLPHGKFSEWEPCQKTLKILKKYHQLNPNFENSIPVIKSFKIKSSSIIGLRGLINLGNTCFMNCILQTLTHIPSLRDYFLGDQHLCSFSNKNNDKNICLVCEIVSLFQEFYSGKKSPYIPFRLLHQVWTQVKHLAGYEQQDAHEFFIAALNAIHKNFVENDINCKSLNMDKKKFINYNNCHCIIDKIFTGGLQSDVICSNCNNISTTVDPFWDISLDIFKSSGKAGRNSLSQVFGETTRLEDCLQKFTFPEILTSFNCSNCKSSRGAKKQFTMKKLPVVCCFHLKRFEQTNRVHKKISDHISFPEVLDMSPFMSNKSTNPNYTPQINKDLGGFDNFNFSNRRLQTNKYFLFAVVNHHGTLESGHYTSFIRLRNDQWFKCSDHIISKASINEVLNSEG
ncbi:ubiquitin carboxyl-terminal hydrolase 22 [Brachionus plicatilis]|uniref:Ubiquitin carboxyl-terminal hydrolase n=1 Tax=Brachionus plicatilis TaxID=10195 RepID=A0A3M7PWJ9_BRAPC|nr:ubiquitin carboxyl-terminal hydrolase 22 [Brachionus plicatilis]